MDDILIEIKCHVPGHETKEFSVTTSENNTVVGTCSGPKVVKLFSCSTQLNMKFFLLIKC